MASDSQPGPAGPATSPDSTWPREYHVAVEEELEVSRQHEFTDAAKFNDWKKVDAMLAECPSLLNTQAPYLCRKWPVLHHAIHNSFLGQVTKLLNMGADIFIKNFDGQDALGVAEVAVDKALTVHQDPNHGRVKLAKKVLEVVGVARQAVEKNELDHCVRMEAAEKNVATRKRGREQEDGDEG